MIEIVFAYLDPLVAREAPVSAFEHRRRKIDSKPRRLREANQNEGQQSAIAAAEIENPRRTLRDTVEQSALALGTVRNFVGPPRDNRLRGSLRSICSRWPCAARPGRMSEKTLALPRGLARWHHN